tara:strand:- start:42 stop:248 length:207 start_codon:yes stop_codon:yes gene_type:complete
MKNSPSSSREKIISKYLVNNTRFSQPKSTNINILLNRVKSNQKNEFKRKLFFALGVSSFLVLFGTVIF